ncbi:hypothetical protein D3C78_1183480 [compost metagenome]
MVLRVSSALTTSTATPIQVSWRAWLMKPLRYCCTCSPAEGTKLRKMKAWIGPPRSRKAGTAASMTKVTVIIGTTANSVV